MQFNLTAKPMNTILTIGIEPTSAIGITLLFIGFCFTATCIYIVSTLNTESLADEKHRALQQIQQKEAISKLYPSNQNNN